MDEHEFPRRLVKQAGNLNFPLIALGAVRELRAHLDLVEERGLRRAREMGASAEDIGHALGITRQGVYYRLKNLDLPQARPGDETDEIAVVPEAEEPTLSRGQ